VSFERSWKARVCAPALALLVAASAVAQTPVPVRVPILLIPGWFDDASELAALRGRLLAAGWRSEQVLAISFADPVGSNIDHSREITAAVNRLRAANLGAHVDIVAHSMGGLATRRFLNDGGAAQVRRVVFLATPHSGTLSSVFAWGEGGKEMHPKSPFLLDLMVHDPVPKGIRAVTIRTPLDLHILPAESATLPGIPDLKVCCVTHAGLLDDPRTFALIERFLNGP
jgi:triacylglycerol lipase